MSIVGNLAKGNDRGGIAVDALVDGNQTIEVRDNVSRNNGGDGIAIGRASGVILRNNTVVDNAGGASFARPER